MREVLKLSSFAKYTLQYRPPRLENITKVIQKYQQKKRSYCETIQMQNQNYCTRYQIKDRSCFGSTCRELKNISKVYKENDYILSRSIKEKEKCFQNIENMKRYWRILRQKSNMRFQTAYDISKPNLWMAIKNLYMVT